MAFSPGGFSVQHDATRGRYVCSNRAYKLGEVVLSEECFALVVRDAYGEVACAYCCRLCVGEPVVAIAADDPIRYCSASCAQSDYGVHAHEAKAVGLLPRLSVQGVDVRAMSDSLRIAIRLGAIRKHGGCSGCSGGRLHPLFGRENHFDDIMLLEANDKLTSADAKQDILGIAMQLEKVAKVAQLPLSRDEIAHLLYAVQCNAHRVTLRAGLGDDAPSPAVGLFPFTSMLNHSCQPSCQHYFISGDGSPPRLVLLALRDIEPGEELCYSYVPLYQSRRARQDQLHAAYGFTCACERCSGGPRDDAIDGPDADSSAAAAVAAIEAALSTCYSLQPSVGPARHAVQQLLACSAKSGAASAALQSPLHRALFQSYYCAATTAHRYLLLGAGAAAEDADIVVACGLLFLGAYSTFCSAPAPEVALVLLCVADALALGSSSGGLTEQHLQGTAEPTDASASALLARFLDSAWGARCLEGFAVDTAPLLLSARRCVSRCGSGSSSIGGDAGVVYALCRALHEGGHVMRGACGHEGSSAGSFASALLTDPRK